MALGPRGWLVHAGCVTIDTLLVAVGRQEAENSEQQAGRLIDERRAAAFSTQVTARSQSSSVDIARCARASGS